MNNTSSEQGTTRRKIVDFGDPVDKTKYIIKVVGVGGGGCNAVRNMYEQGIADVTFAVCNTDSQSLSKSPVPVKVLLGDRGLGVGGKPEKGREDAETSRDRIKSMLSDGTQMVFVTAGMGGGTGTGAAPVVASVAKEMGLLTIGVVTIPFYFEKEKKIVKALKGVEEMRKNVDALLIINNERLCDIFSDTRVSVKEAFKTADNILSNAVRSISELITIEGDINLDFCDVESTMKSGGGAIMAMGRASGENRVKDAISNALDSPLLYGNDVRKAQRILFNIYTSPDHPLYVDEMNEIDEFMDNLSPKIDVIWGVSDDSSLGEDAKIAILATGMDEDTSDFSPRRTQEISDEQEHYRDLIKKLYEIKRKPVKVEQEPENVPLVVNGDTSSTLKNDSDSTIDNDVADEAADKAIADSRDDDNTKDDETGETDDIDTQHHDKTPRQTRKTAFIDTMTSILNKIKSTVVEE